MTKSEQVKKIFDRASDLGIIGLVGFNAQLSYLVHTGKLKANELLEADDFNFALEIIGIHTHFNSDTMEVDNHFLPRFASPE